MHLLRDRRRPPEPDLEDLSDHALLGSMGTPSSRAALRELFERHGAAVHRLVCLVAADGADVDALVEDVFLTLSRRAGRLEDDIENVRLGLLAMAWRRSCPAGDAVPAAAWSPGDEPTALPELRCLPSGNRDALALTVLAAATLTEVAVVLQLDRRATAVAIRGGMRRVAVNHNVGLSGRC